ncbi:hypothetical protein HAX54_047494 [Datura stramonium]|uniref:peroxidase n=1 Tax=Datura stramonium TaxID=4076 RepID=A0ABS8WM22_DATST|nr:hypothetical protein [Datura stramonium]
MLLTRNSNKLLSLSLLFSVSSSAIYFVEYHQPGNTAEKDHPDNLSLAGDGFDTVIKAKAAIDSNSRCRNKFMFASHGLTQADMIALSAAHSVEFLATSFNRIYNFSPRNPIDPTLNKQYAAQLQGMCQDVDPRIAINMDPKTPRTFDNNYFKNLQQGMGLFTSDQVLYTDRRSKGTVDLWASNSKSFQNAFVGCNDKAGPSWV